MSRHFLLLQLLFYLLNAEEYKTLYMEDYCGKPGTTIIVTNSTGPYSRGIIQGSRDSNYPTGQNCDLILKPPHGYGILLSLDDVSLRTGVYRNCIDYLEIKVLKGLEWEDMIKVCSIYSMINSYKADDCLRLRFFSDKSCCSFGAGFRVTYTTYQNAPCSRSDSFKCENENCIWDKLVCDFHNNCGDNSDELLYEGAKCAHSKTTKVIIAAVCSIVGVIILVAIIACICRRRRQKVLHRSTLTHEAIPPSAPSAKDQSIPFGYRQSQENQDYGSIKDTEDGLIFNTNTEIPPPYNTPQDVKYST